MPLARWCDVQQSLTHDFAASNFTISFSLAVIEKIVGSFL